MSEENEFQLPSQVTLGYLVDELGKAREEKALAERKENFFKEAFKGRLPDGEKAVAGDLFRAEIATQDRTTLSASKVEAEIGVEECYNRGWYQTSTFPVIRTKRVA
jgi:hypothetical protein